MRILVSDLLPSWVRRTLCFPAPACSKALATLTKNDGRKLVFESMAVDELGQIGRNKRERRIVNAERFMQVAYKRCDQPKMIVK